MPLNDQYECLSSWPAAISYIYGPALLRQRSSLRPVTYLSDQMMLHSQVKHVRLNDSRQLCSQNWEFVHGVQSVWNNQKEYNCYSLLLQLKSLLCILPVVYTA